MDEGTDEGISNPSSGKQPVDDGSELMDITFVDAPLIWMIWVPSNG